MAVRRGAKKGELGGLLGSLRGKGWQKGLRGYKGSRDVSCVSCVSGVFPHGARMVLEWGFGSGSREGKEGAGVGGPFEGDAHVSIIQEANLMVNPRCHVSLREPNTRFLPVSPFSLYVGRVGLEPGREEGGGGVGGVGEPFKVRHR